MVSATTPSAGGTTTWPATSATSRKTAPSVSAPGSSPPSRRPICPTRPRSTRVAFSFAAARLRNEPGAVGLLLSEQRIRSGQKPGVARAGTSAFSGSTLNDARCTGGRCRCLRSIVSVVGKRRALGLAGAESLAMACAPAFSLCLPDLLLPDLMRGGGWLRSAHAPAGLPVEQVHIPDVDPQPHGLPGPGVNAAVHQQHQFVLAHLHQQFGLGAGGLDHHHLRVNVRVSAAACRSKRDVARPDAVVHGLPVRRRQVCGHGPACALPLNMAAPVPPPPPPPPPDGWGGGARGPPGPGTGRPVPARCHWPSITFIDGEPMNCATNRLSGRSYRSSGVPICSTTPSCSTTMRSAMVMASIWSCVT